MFLSHLAYFFLTSTLIVTYSSPVQNKENPVYRLPDNILPEHYELSLNLKSDVFETNEFDGILELTIKPTSTAREIKLHANRLKFSEIKLSTANGQEILLENRENIVTDNVTDILTLVASEDLVVENSYRLYFNYTGQLRSNDDMHGFYKSVYTENGSIKYLATTQFQDTYARRAFPCFDEPKFKATFTITIHHPSSLSAISNTPIVSTALDEDVTTTIFDTTPIMSTYLVAFIISEFTCDTSSPSDLISVPHRICSRNELQTTRKLALDVGPKLLNALEKFTGINYNYSGIGKIDQVAIPDFSAGAMENWGLATYRETALLWDEDESSNRNKQRVETVIAHELAHMWFGDLVTTHWWSDTFLNEGFATYFEYFITSEIELDWQLDKQFVIEELHPVLQSDALKNSQPLSLEVSSPAEVSGRFGSISYNKGGSVIRMVEHFMGKENFKAGLHKYLEDNAFNYTRPEDLWEALSGFVSELPVELPTVMENWVTKAGYPLLQVEIVDSDVLISQKRFFTDDGISDDSDKWYIPISYTLSTDFYKFENTSPKYWLKPYENLKMSNVITNEHDWIILNNQQTGYYRVSYGDDLLERISIALNKPGFDGIHVLNRAQLVDDFYNLAKAGLKTYSEFLDFLMFLKKDSDYFPWYSAITAFSGILYRTGNEQLRTKLSEYLLNLMEVFYNQVPFDDNRDYDQIYTHTKVLALTWACNVGNENCISNSLEYFNEYKTKNVKPNKNLRSIIYCNGLRYSTSVEEDWNFLWEEYVASKLATEQATILTALGCAKSENILTEFLSKSISATDNIKPQDALSVFSAVYSGNSGGVDIAADFLYKNYQKISEYYGTMNAMSSLINGLTSRFNKQEQIEKLKKFATTEDLPEALKDVVDKALQNSLINLSLTDKLENQLTAYFAVEFSSATFLKFHFTSVVVVLPIILWGAH